ncbi:MAG: PAS domain S-box protein [Phycisphaerales bacterium]
MSEEKNERRTKAQLLAEIEQLRWRLEEAEQTLDAIRHGEVDGLVVIGPQGEQVFSLSGAEHVYRVIIETMNEAALTVTPDGTILFCNQRFCELLKVPTRAVMGRKVTAFVAGPQQAPLKKLLADAQTRPVQRRLTLRAEDGAEVPVQLAASFLQTDDSPSICLVASDLTELEASANSIRVLREHQQALEESEARFRAIFESSQDAVILMDDEGICVQANPAAQAIFDRSPAQLLGKRVFDFFGWPMSFAALWQSFLAQGSFRTELQMMGDACGHVRHVDCCAVANILPGRHLSVIRDISESKRARQALQDANEQLQTQTEELQAQGEELQAQSEELRTQSEELHVQSEELQAQTEELRIANKQLKESEQRLEAARVAAENERRRLEAVMEALPVGVAIVDTQGGHTHANNAFERIWGGSRPPVHSVSDYAAYQAWWADTSKFVAPEEWASAQVLSQGAPVTGQVLEIQRFDGSRAFVVNSAAPVRDAEGRIVGSAVAIQDISDLHRAKTALQASEEQFRTLAENSPDMVSRFDRQSRYLYLNAAGAQLHDCPAGEIIGKTIAETGMPEPYRSRWQQRIEQVFATGCPLEVEDRIPVAAGRRHFQSLCVPERDAGGNIATVLVVSRDITERKRTEELMLDVNAALESKVAERTRELEHRARQLAKLALELSQTEDRERKRMAEILHDDLQQQLAAMKFHLGLLGSRVKHDASQLAVVTRLDGMLKDAVEKSRSLSHELSPAVLYQDDIGRTFTWLARQMQEQHGLIVRVDVHGEVRLQFDPMKAFLYKAAQEMLFNIIKHARVSEAVIRLRRCGRHVCLSVVDRGRGFDPSGLKETTGFGLFSIRERAELLGGRMKIRSAEGKGSTLLLVVPDEMSSDTPASASGHTQWAQRPGLERERTGSAADGRCLRVLVADDHEVVRHGLIAVLREEPGVEVIGEAANGREAVDLAVRLKPDVIIMDVAMPLIQGDGATRQIKIHLPDVRVIALSMYDEPETIERMRQAGAEAYVLKTAPSEELLAAIWGK